MTQQANVETEGKEQCGQEVSPGREVPEINEEVDKPFLPQVTTGEVAKYKVDNNLGERLNLTAFKFKTGRTVLFSAMIAMIVLVVLDVVVKRLLGAQSADGILESAFEAFKLIAMTVLGYIFGTSNNNTEE